MRDAMSDDDKSDCKRCILELLSQGMPVVSDTPLEFRLSVASIIGGVGVLSGSSREMRSRHDKFVSNAAVIMAYLAEATDDEIVTLIRESKAGAN
jgi:hypothetical protein